MKKTIAAILAIGSVVCMAGYVEHGFGRVLTATTTPQVIVVGTSTNELDWAERCSVAIGGSETVYFMKNVSTNEFVLTNAIPVSSGNVHEFLRGQKYFSVCYATATNSSEFDISFE